MPRGQALSRAACLLVIAIVYALRSYGVPRVFEFIHDHIDRAVSMRTLYRVAQNPEIYLNNRPRVRPGPSRLLSGRTDRFLARCVQWRNGQQTIASARQIRADAGLTVSEQTIRRALNRIHTIRRTGPRVGFLNGPRQRAARVEWAQEHGRRVNWRRIFYCDEKRFSLDGPDRPVQTYRDMRVEQPRHIRRVAGGGSVMLMLLLGSDGFINVSVIDGNVNANNVFDFMSEALSDGDTVLLDNASVHTAITDELRDEGIRLLFQPPYSPDIQPVEQVFSIISRLVYADNLQFMTKAQLIARIDTVIRHMIYVGTDIHLFNRLSASMGGRLQSIIDNNGGPIYPSYS